MESESAVLIDVDREAEPMRRGSVVMTRAYQADTEKHSQAARRR